MLTTTMPSVLIATLLLSFFILLSFEFFPLFATQCSCFFLALLRKWQVWDFARHGFLARLKAPGNQSSLDGKQPQEIQQRRRIIFFLVVTAVAGGPLFTAVLVRLVSLRPVPSCPKDSFGRGQTPRTGIVPPPIVRFAWSW